MDRHARPSTTSPLGITLDGAAAPQAVAASSADVADRLLPRQDLPPARRRADSRLLQCGSLDGTGGADPGYSYGPIENAPADGIYPAGTIAMARAGDDAYSNGHQFFIVYGDTTIPADAAGGYTVVGQVTSGLDSSSQQHRRRAGIAGGRARRRAGRPDDDHAASRSSNARVRPNAVQ